MNISEYDFVLILQDEQDISYDVPKLSDILKNEGFIPRRSDMINIAEDFIFERHNDGVEFFMKPYRTLKVKSISIDMSNKLISIRFKRINKDVLYKKNNIT